MPQSSHSERLMDLLVEWEESRLRGRDVSVGELCPNDATLADELARRIDQLRALESSLRVESHLTDDSGASAPLGSSRGNDGETELIVASESRLHRLRLHARGGLGEVFVALDEMLGREVALKQIQDQFARDSNSRLRFLAEARITAGLEHPGVVPVHGLGQYPDGRPYYAMRLIQGESLGDAITRFHSRYPSGSLPEERARALQSLLRRFLDVCNTMAYAHSRGVIHRDLKPDNIMLGPYGETLVVDWGIAKVVASVESARPEPGPQPLASCDDGITQVGAAIGTPAFMSPEQAKGDLDRLGPASDIYSLGATLYCLLAGRPPRDGENAARVIRNVQDGDFRPPSAIRSDVPRALEAICLNAMALDPSERYGSARALADDIERWMADAPISAMREPWRLWAKRSFKRHRTLAVASASALVIGVLAGGYFLYERQAQALEREARLGGLVLALETAETREVPRLLSLIDTGQEAAVRQLRAAARSAEARKDERGHIHAALALLSREPMQAAYLGGRLSRPEASPEEVHVIAVKLREEGHAKTTATGLWRNLKETNAPEFSGAQLRAAAGLAILDPSNPQWSEIAPLVSSRLIRENPVLLPAWREAFQPVSRRLLRSLRSAYSRGASPTEHTLAFTLLVDFATQRENSAAPEDLADLVPDAGPDQFRMIIDRLRDRDRATSHLLSLLQERTPSEDDATARRRSRLTVALAFLGRHDLLWDSLRFVEAPAVRSYVIRDLFRFGVNPAILMERLRSPCEVSIKRAILLALGEYPIGEIPPEELRSLTTRLLAEFQSARDPGLHSTIEWLLRQRWSCGESLDRLVKATVGAKRSGQDFGWFVNGQCQTMVCVSGPVEFMMGSPPHEEGHDPDEVQHQVKIDRSFAIATCEVTVAQYEQFLDQQPDLKALFQGQRGMQLRQYSPSPDCPMVAVDWYDAARYCNWLSQQESISEDQWCYPKKIGPGMLMPPGYLSRLGYRLPTEAEWEYACRSGTVSARFYGLSDALLTEYAWILQNAGTRTHPVGRRKPNDLGLFDMFGNAHEWVQDPFGEYPSGPKRHMITDVEIPTRYEDRVDGVLRGGSFEHPLADTRSAHRYSVALRSMRRAITTFGFRVAKTCH